MVSIFTLILDTKFNTDINLSSVMAGKNKTSKQRPATPIGSQVMKQTLKETDFYHKHKSTFWTIALLIVLLVFFIINNTRKIPEEGSYPPNYLKGNSESTDSQ